MVQRNRPRRPAMYNTPAIRNGGFGALQVEAITNRPLSIARRHLAASQLRMRDIEPDELSSSEWVRFLVMEEAERERWINAFRRHRRNSNESTSSVELDQETAASKTQEARREAEDARRSPFGGTNIESSSSTSALPPTGSTPAVSLWARSFANDAGQETWNWRRPMHARRAVTDGIIEAPPTYETAVRPSTPPPAYEPRDEDDLRSPSP